MTITEKRNEDTLILELEGRLDTTTAPELEEVVKTKLDGVAHLTLDMEKLEYVSSAGLRVILTAQKIMNKQGDMKLVHVNELVMEVFEVTGFVDVLNIEQ